MRFLLETLTSPPFTLLNLCRYPLGLSTASIGYIFSQLLVFVDGPCRNRTCDHLIKSSL